MNKKNIKFFNNDIFDKVEDLLKVKPIEDILNSLGIVFKPYNGGYVIRGKCPDHYHYTGRYPSGDTDWVVNIDRGVTFCHTEKRASNIVIVAKNIKNFKTLEEAFDFISQGYTIEDKYSKCMKGEKRTGFNPRQYKRKEITLDEKRKKEYNTRISMASSLISKGFVHEDTIKFFENDGMSLKTIKDFNIVSLNNGFSKYRCLIPFFDHINLNKVVGYVAVNTLSKHDYIKRIGAIYFKNKNISDFTSIKKIYIELINRYKKAIYLKDSLMNKNLFGLNNLIRKNISLKEIYIVQGERDAMKMQQQGFPAVGTHGSHLSLEQLTILKNIGTTTIYVVYDSDKAGIEGAQKACQQALSKGFKVFNIFPNGHDPKKYNRQEMLEIINSQVEKNVNNKWAGLINKNAIKLKKEKNEKSKVS